MKQASLEDKVEDYSLCLLSEHPVSNAFWFTVMRFVRLIAALVCEVLTYVFATAFAVFLFLTCCWAGLNILFVLGIIFATIGGAEWSMNDNLWYAALAPKPGEKFAHPVQAFFVMHPYLIMVPSFILMTLSFAQALAFGVPYRFTNSPPGSMTVRCGGCKAEIRNGLKCNKCGKYRIASHAALQLLWVANVVLTSLWAIHDAINFLIGIAGGRRH